MIQLILLIYSLFYSNLLYANCSDLGFEVALELRLPGLARDYHLTPQAEAEYMGLLSSRSFGIYGRPLSQQTYKVSARDELANTYFSSLAKLSEAESLAVADYVTSNYQTLNTNLRDKDIKLTREDILFSKALSSALNRLPDFKGSLHREENFESNAQMQQFLEQFIPGKTITINQFYSTSKNRNIKLGRNPYQVYVFIQNSTSGKDLAPIHFDEHEGEVLFHPFTQFKILRIENETNPGTGQTSKKIILEEVVHPNYRYEVGARDFSKLDLKDIVHFYRASGYYPGPLRGVFENIDFDFEASEFQFNRQGLLIAYNNSDATLIGEGNNAKLYAFKKKNSQEDMVLKLAHDQKGPALIAEYHVQRFLAQQYNRYKIQTVDNIRLGKLGKFLLRAQIPKNQLASEIPTLSSQQQKALHDLWLNARKFARETGIPLDLKADNLAWNGNEWVLFDCGPRMGYLPYGWTLDLRTFDQYLRVWRSFDPPESRSPNTIDDVLSRF